MTKLAQSNRTLQNRIDALELRIAALEQRMKALDEKGPWACQHTI